TGVSDAGATLWNGLFLPMAVAGGLTLIAVLLRSRAVVVLAGLFVLGFTILWMVRQGQAAGTLTAGGSGLAEGVGVALGGGVLLFLGALVMRGRGGAGGHRRRGHARGRDERDDDRFEREDEFGPPGPYEEPYGPPGPHGAYQADEYYGPPPGPGDTPAQEWDPWDTGRPGPPQPPQGPQQDPHNDRPPRRPRPYQGRDGYY
ncbi:MAG: hypothetical protein ACRDP3_28255, partial [Streptomyces sp.]